MKSRPNPGLRRACCCAPGERPTRPVAVSSLPPSAARRIPPLAPAMPFAADTDRRGRRASSRPDPTAGAGAEDSGRLRRTYLPGRASLPPEATTSTACAIGQCADPSVRFRSGRALDEPGLEGTRATSGALLEAWSRPTGQVAGVRDLHLQAASTVLEWRDERRRAESSPPRRPGLDAPYEARESRLPIQFGELRAPPRRRPRAGARNDVRLWRLRSNVDDGDVPGSRTSHELGAVLDRDRGRGNQARPSSMTRAAFDQDPARSSWTPACSDQRAPACAMRHGNRFRPARSASSRSRRRRRSRPSASRDAPNTAPGCRPAHVGRARPRVHVDGGAPAGVESAA